MFYRIFSRAAKMIAVVLVFSLLTPAAAADRLTVAVFDFESRDAASAGAGEKISELIRSELSLTGNFLLLERQKLEQILSEQSLGVAGMADESKAVQTGKLMGAKILVLGRVFTLDHELVAIAKIIGTETSRVEAAVVKAPLSPDLKLVSGELAKKISVAILEKAGEFTATRKPEENIVQEIRQQLQGKKIPSVAVVLAEEYSGGSMVDPAAEMEIIYLLNKCGFTVTEDPALTEWAKNYPRNVSPPKETKVDTLIVGEAIGEFGVREGDLVSGKARLEVKVFDLKTGKILAAERQTSVAVDVGEQIAARTALQNAAAASARRFIPEMVFRWNESAGAN